MDVIILLQFRATIRTVWWTAVFNKNWFYTIFWAIDL